MPLAGCRDSVPAGVWGNAPTVPRPANSKGKFKRGSLGRRQRSVPAQ
nr:MAG TPA: hypothetical protein [Caudoviricetes sp.]